MKNCTRFWRGIMRSKELFELLLPSFAIKFLFISLETDICHGCQGILIVNGNFVCKIVKRERIIGWSNKIIYRSKFTQYFLLPKGFCLVVSLPLAWEDTFYLYLCFDHYRQQKSEKSCLFWLSTLLSWYLFTTKQTKGLFISSLVFFKSSIVDVLWSLQTHIILIVYKFSPKFRQQT